MAFNINKWATDLKSARNLAEQNAYRFFVYNLDKEYPELGVIAAQNLLAQDSMAFFYHKLHKSFPELVTQSILQEFIKKHPYKFFTNHLDDIYPEFGKLAAQNVVEQLPYGFFYYRLNKKYPELEKLAVQNLVEQKPHTIFDFELDKKYPELGKLAAQSLAKRSYQLFIKLNLHNKYPELGKMVVNKLIEDNPTRFFTHNFNKEYPELIPIAAQVLAEQNAYYFFAFDLNKKYPKLEEMAARTLIEQRNFDEFLLFGLGKKYPELEKKAIENIVERSPWLLFEHGLNKKYPELEEMAVQEFVKTNDGAFFHYKLEEKYPELGKIVAQGLLMKEPDVFFHYKLEEKYPDLTIEKYFSQVPEPFISNQDPTKNNFWYLNESKFQTEQRPEETKDLKRFDFSINNPIGKENKLEQEMLSNLFHQAEDEPHTIGVSGYTKAWALVSFPNKDEIIIEQIQSDLPAVLFQINKDPEYKKMFKEQYGNDAVKNFMHKYAKFSILYPYIVLEKIVSFAIVNKINTIKLSSFDNIMDLAAISNEKKAKKIYKQLPEQLGFKKEGSFYVYKGNLEKLKNNINALKEQELNSISSQQPSISKRDKKPLDLDRIKEKILQILGDRANLIQISENLSDIMKSIGQARKSGKISKQEHKLLSGIIPKMVVASFENLMEKVAMYAEPITKKKRNFYLSKRASQVIVQPWDPAVNSALQKIEQIDPILLKNVKKIIIHPGGGTALGYVEMGPGKDPQEIHLYKDMIKNNVLQNANNPNKQTLTTQELEQAVINGIMEVLAHEAGHIGKHRTPEQIQQEPFFGEPEAEREAKEFMSKIQSVDDAIVEASLLLEQIRIKYLPNYNFVEPDLEFTIYASRNKSQAIRKGLELIKNGNNTPIIKELNKVINNKYIGLVEYYISNPTSFKLANWQYEHNLRPTGYMDKNTIKKMSMIKTAGLPKNFAVVVPNRIYRGGMIFNAKQMEALKNLGIERVVSLHASPEIARMCNMFGIEHIPAFIENGGAEDLGRKVLGNNVYGFLNEKPTYVHCYFGEDRTGGVIARYRVESGWSCKKAYQEAKTYGFKDMFVDLIDWFSELCVEKPIDTNKMRRALKGKEPYRNPELEQEVLDVATIGPAPPTDMPYPGIPGYTELITEPTPTGIMSVPFSRG